MAQKETGMSIEQAAQKSGLKVKELFERGRERLRGGRSKSEGKVEERRPREKS